MYQAASLVARQKAASAKAAKTSKAASSETSALKDRVDKSVLESATHNLKAVLAESDSACLGTLSDFAKNALGLSSESISFKRFAIEFSAALLAAPQLSGFSQVKASMSIGPLLFKEFCIHCKKKSRTSLGGDKGSALATVSLERGRRQKRLGFDDDI